MARNIETIENGVLNEKTCYYTKIPDGDSSIKSNMAKWWLLGINCVCTVLGTIAGPLFLRLYFLHGGNRKWIPSWLQTAGVPVLLGPLTVLYLRERASGVRFLAPTKLLLLSAGIGILVGLNDFMYSHGLSFLPVSTSALLLSTQLGFTALFALLIAKQKFTPYSINAVVLMTLGAALLGLSKSGDRLLGVSNRDYWLGFVLTLGAAGLLGFILPCCEVAYATARKTITYSVVLQFQFGVNFFATVFCTIGMLINKDFQAIPREANAFELGAVKYYLVLVSIAIVWQMAGVGTLGVVFSTTSLFAGVLNATLLPLTETAAVIVYHEKFTGEKGMALALCSWGFISYFYGSYKEKKKQDALFETGSR
ncbi:PREDICTED: purine permease 3-like [Nelumbo nucifera]|uniref:Probable purine permease n=2 Tax=Nelumbo nucifera TaxID=4432 RepID=A0A1U8AKC2_NELNU|nr:PREDICTED: purine permease 3-like [Nelumbo nucifera]DAD28969.1 TPA_asm: hypothetical protein HUJ06_030437 [Nelumbo nucifera]